jgi:hypothetical protein
LGPLDTRDRFRLGAEVPCGVPEEVPDGRAVQGVEGPLAGVRMAGGLGETARWFLLTAAELAALFLR